MGVNRGKVKLFRFDLKIEIGIWVTRVFREVKLIYLLTTHTSTDD